ncbi:MAG: FAD synthase [Thermoplasmatales archaeon]|jgi:FAD synthetase|nr:FAD synthase [Candidatus Thermoplasmatota archaeon]MCL6003588.1 FAD synthase [Candidatus Thermoplasmatota archaeon]MDA8054767.1 FAD synthase [Thermoplasmatales archaeon]
MIRVLATGVFDILHPGHVHFLTEARKLGDELFVVVARDSVAQRMKRLPFIPENIRVSMVASLKPVDRAILGVEGNIYDILTIVKPDIVALGYDQDFNVDEIVNEGKKRGINLKVVRISKYSESEFDGTRKIIKMLKTRS